MTFCWEGLREGLRVHKLTQKATETSEQMVKTLANTGEVTSQKMFGGYGSFIGLSF